MYMSQKQGQLQQLSSDLVRLFFEEHDCRKLNEYLCEDISLIGTHEAGSIHCVQEVRRVLQDVCNSPSACVKLQNSQCEIIYQKQGAAVALYSCIQYSQAQNTSQPFQLTLVWEKETKGWKICHMHYSYAAEAVQRDAGADSRTSAMLPIHKQDTLTQIFNLEGFVEAAQEILQHTDQQFALFKFGISDFRFINQIHGYAFGDDVLKCIARNLKFFCQEDELCARIEKDTFAVLLHFTDSDAFHNRLHRIREKLLDASIAACLKHPIQYIGGVYLIKDTFQLYIQPQFQLSDEKIISGEALSRWFLEDGSCVPPDEFIPLFEKHGMISSFDFYVLHKLCKLMRQWMDAGKQLLPVSVNQSRLHIKEEHYLQNFCNIVDSYAIPHEMIVFELTESAFTDCANDLQVFMKNIHEAGFQIAIDDFGTGYAGIGMLSQVDADILKLDKGMLNGINTDRRQMTIFWKIIEMAHSIGMQVICEGIETMEQFVDLKMLRCDIGQGFLVSRAISADEFAAKYLA